MVFNIVIYLVYLYISGWFFFFLSIAKFSGNGIMSVFPGMEHGFASTTIFLEGEKKTPTPNFFFLNIST